MGLGRELGKDADSSATIDSLLFKAPPVPLGVEGGMHGQGAEQTETTRLLSAAAYLRLDSVAEFRAWQKKERAKLKKKLTPEFVQKWLDKKQIAQKDADADEVPEKPQPKVIVGHGYVRWVRNRAAAGRPVPAFGFELTPVIERCAAAEDLLYLRRAVMTLAVLAGLTFLRTTAAELAPVVAVAGLWAAFYLDRFLAHRRLVRMIGDSIETGTRARGLTRKSRRALTAVRQLKFGRVIPYVTEIRAGSPR